MMEKLCQFHESFVFLDSDHMQIALWEMFLLFLLLQNEYADTKQILHIL